MFTFSFYLYYHIIIICLCIFVCLCECLKMVCVRVYVYSCIGQMCLQSLSDIYFEIGFSVAWCSLFLFTMTLQEAQWSFCVCLPRTGIYKWVPPHLTFYTGAEAPNSSPHAYIALYPGSCIPVFPTLIVIKADPFCKSSKMGTSAN